MLQAITFENYRVLRHTTLRLGPFNLLIGANGSGKSTVIDALRSFAKEFHRSGLEPQESTIDPPAGHRRVSLQWVDGSRCEALPGKDFICGDQSAGKQQDIEAFIRGIHCFQWDAEVIRSGSALVQNPVVDSSGIGLHGEGVSHQISWLASERPECFQRWQEDFLRCFPEYRAVTLDPDSGTLQCELAIDGQPLPLSALSEGTLYGLALLLLSHCPGNSTLICIEEPDRGIAPRLLSEIRDALYRLAFPEQFDLNRPAVQVIATTHSPYLLDLFHECPEQVTVTTRHDDGSVQLHRLVDDPERIKRIDGASLGEVWFAGLLDG